MEKPLSVEIILPDTNTLHRCIDCEVIWRDLEDSYPSHQAQALANLPKDIAREYEDLSHWAAELLNKYSDLVQVRIVDALSFEGVAKSMQFHINYYPAVIINHQSLYTWSTLDEASEVIAEIMGRYNKEQQSVEKREQARVHERNLHPAD